MWLSYEKGAGAVVFAHQHPVADDPSALGALCKLAQLQTNVSVNAFALNLQLDRQVEHADIWGWLEKTEGQENEFSSGALLESLILEWQKMKIGAFEVFKSRDALLGWRIIVFGHSILPSTI